MKQPVIPQPFHQQFLIGVTDLKLDDSYVNLISIDSRYMLKYFLNSFGLDN